MSAGVYGIAAKNVLFERFARTVIDVWKEFICYSGGMSGLNFHYSASSVRRRVQFYSLVIDQIERRMQKFTENAIQFK